VVNHQVDNGEVQKILRGGLPPSGITDRGRASGRLFFDGRRQRAHGYAERLGDDNDVTDCERRLARQSAREPWPGHTELAGEFGLGLALAGQLGADLAGNQLVCLGSGPVNRPIE
jgi:hypothetical protein